MTETVGVREPAAPSLLAEVGLPRNAPVVLGASAAATCPVKTDRTFDPTVHLPEPLADSPTALPPFVVRARAVEAQLLETLISTAAGLVVDLRLLADDPAASAAACLQAMAVGAEVIVGGTLPLDPAGHRVGRPDVLLRGADNAAGRPAYHPVEVKAHKVLLARRPLEAASSPGAVGAGRVEVVTADAVLADAAAPEAIPADAAPPVGSDPAPSTAPRSARRPTWTPSAALAAPSAPPLAAETPPVPALPPTLRYSTLAQPRPLALRPLEGVVFRLRHREGDLLQLAHYQRMLATAGYAAAEPLAAVIGTDTLVDGQPVLVWVDLTQPQVRTYSRSAPEGWRLRSVLERYDFEHARRVAVADAARRRTGGPEDLPPLVQPVVHDECGRCPWWQRCRTELPDDDVGLRIDKGALDVRELLALRRLGVPTVRALAEADLDRLAPAYLPLVTHRDGTESRLRTAYRRAGMLQAGVSFARETSGPIEVPSGRLEVDLDIESSADGRVYLWGFLLQDTTRSAAPSYHQFSSFTDLDDDAEVALAGEAFAWLRGLAEAAGPVRVYHYSSYEPHTITTLAARSDDPRLAWAVAFAEEQFVDLYDVVKAHFFGVSGLGLKLIAAHAGFRWRDDDPGGLNSQLWFADAVHQPDGQIREQARQRVLEYNEDDVRATSQLRAWLRAR